MDSNEIRKCYDCDTEITQEQYEAHEWDEVHGDIICESCRDNYMYCENCEENKDDDDFDEKFKDNPDTIWCGECIRRDGYKCDDCSDYFKDRDKVCEYNNGYVCDSCRENYMYCYACEELTNNDDSRYCESCENDFCQACYVDNHDCDSGDEFDADYTPLRTDENGEYLTSSRLVGVEIEAENGRGQGMYNDLPTGTGKCSDGSLSNGVEIQSRPANRKIAEDHIKQITKVLQDRNFEISKSCGLHVHLDASDFVNDHTKIVNMLHVMFSIEDMIFSMLPPSRWVNSYCKHLTLEYLEDLFREPKNDRALADAWYKGEGSRSGKYQESRYTGFNLHSLYYRGTIEYRYHSGTINATKILQWIKLLQAITDYAANDYSKESIDKLLDMETGKKKLTLMIKTFKLDSDLAEYIEKRMSSFNPKFVVKFNKGKIENSKKIDKTLVEINDLLETMSAENDNIRIVKRAKQLYENSKTKKFLTESEIQTLINDKNLYQDQAGGEGL